jgi:hypothetical protein
VPVVPPLRPRRALCQRLSDPAQGRREIARRSERRGKGFHRPARLDEVYLPGGGWIGLDPTSGLLAGEGHIPLACTPDPSSAAPISGAVDECECEFSFEMSVTRIYESPRVTLPYTDEQWKKSSRSATRLTPI